MPAAAGPGPGAATASDAVAGRVLMSGGGEGERRRSGPSGLAAARILLPRGSRRWQGRPECASVPAMTPAVSPPAPTCRRWRRRLARLLLSRAGPSRWPWLASVFLLAFAVRSLHAVDLALALESQVQPGARMMQRYDEGAAAILRG